MIEVQGLIKHYGVNVAVDGISFAAGKGEVVGFLGPNGAGKSTTLKILAGFLAPTAGRAKVGGLDVLEDPVGARRQLGYLPENTPLYPDMTVGGFLRFAAAMHGVPRSGIAAALERVLEVCGLRPRLYYRLKELSRGYRQRVGLAQALVGDPPVLLLDEPTSGLDPLQTREMRDVIRRIGREKTVLLSTHVMQEVEAMCSRAIIIARGRIAGDGSFAQLRRQAEPRARLRLVAGAPAAELRRALEEAGGLEVLDAAPEADGARAEVRAAGDEAALAARLAALAAGRRWAVRELTPLAPSLEEVFVALVQENRP